MSSQQHIASPKHPASQEHINCPSHRCKPGSDLIGVRQDDGTVAILPQPLPVDQSFIERVNRNPIAPEERFRFSNKCVQGGCEQWTGTRCGFIDRTLKLMETALATKSALPPCGIRPSCRWFIQSGSDACRVCPYVITNVTAADTELPIPARRPP